MSLVRSLIIAGLWFSVTGFAPAEEPFGIRVVDEASGRGVPLITLRTVNQIRLVTDSAGWVTFDEPGLLGLDVFFFVEGDGYTFPKDGFGMQGTRLRTKPGGRAELKVTRTNVAERLYRITGGGIYAESVRLGVPVPLGVPLLNAQVVGQDSVLSVVFGGKIHWFWGDTSRALYPLGNFHTSGATSAMPGPTGFDPSLGIPLAYFQGDDGFARPVCKMDGEGPTWASGLTVLKDESGRERMFVGYAKIRGFLEAYRRGLAEWDTRAEEFRHVAEIAVDAPVRPDGHSFEHEIDGKRWVYFANPYALTRVPASVESWLDLSQYEGFTCLERGAPLGDARVDRDADGRPVWGWKRATAGIGPPEQAVLVKRGLIKEEECWFRLRDIETRDSVRLHSGSMAWNDYRRKWILVAVETGGKPSPLGEVWYAEADAPEGPWELAAKVASHAEYTFYNPRQHPFLDQDGGRLIYFEGTYSALFSKVTVPTPRYDYNQVMYRLDLDHPKLAALRR